MIFHKTSDVSYLMIGMIAKFCKFHKISKPFLAQKSHRPTSVFLEACSKHAGLPISINSLSTAICGWVKSEAKNRPQT